MSEKTVCIQLKQLCGEQELRQVLRDCHVARIHVLPMLAFVQFQNANDFDTFQFLFSGGVLDELKGATFAQVQPTFNWFQLPLIQKNSLDKRFEEGITEIQDSGTIELIGQSKSGIVEIISPQKLDYLENRIQIKSETFYPVHTVFQEEPFQKPTVFDSPISNQKLSLAKEMALNNNQQKIRICKLEEQPIHQHLFICKEQIIQKSKEHEQQKIFTTNKSFEQEENNMEQKPILAKLIFEKELIIEKESPIQTQISCKKEPYEENTIIFQKKIETDTNINSMKSINGYVENNKIFLIGSTLLLLWFLVMNSL